MQVYGLICFILSWEKVLLLVPRTFSIVSDCLRIFLRWICPPFVCFNVSEDEWRGSACHFYGHVSHWKYACLMGLAFADEGRGITPEAERSGQRRGVLRLVARDRIRGRVGKGVLCCCAELRAEIVARERTWSFRFPSPRP